MQITILITLFITAVFCDNQTINDNDYNFMKGNKLWSGILKECKTASISCIQKNVYHYLDETFRYSGDVKVGEMVNFKQNTIDYHKYSREANEVKDDDNLEEEEEEEMITPLEEVTRALHNKSVGFLMSHDTEIKLPEMLFEGATLKVQPRGFEGEGVLVKLDLIPKEIQENQPVGRIFFKKIKKFFKNKLIMALMSILLVISLIKSVLMFLMPLVVGVGTAKKILLKVLLFVFPALSHLFKLCSYYHDSYHGTKYHHHHHQIAHIHHLPSLHHTVPDVHFPPSGGPPPGKYEHDDFEFSGPGLGPEYISNRKAYEQHTPSKNDENEIKSWGLGQAQGHKASRRGHKPAGAAATLTHNQIEELAMQAEREVLLKSRLQQEHQRIRQENLQLQEQLKQELKLQEQLKLQALMIAQHKTKLQPQHSVQQVQHIVHTPSQQLHVPPQQLHVPPQQLHVPAQHAQLVQPSQLIVQPQIVQHKVSVAGPVYDAFYSPILDKIDKIFNSIGIAEEPCRERLVCSMYKNPVKFSPHSNLLSAELSRDSKDLQKPTSSNDAVVRFYRYVQAARDGQDQRECLRLYPSCNINTEL